MTQLFHKVAIIGAGDVGCTTAYTLMQTGVISEIVLIDIDEKKVSGQVADLQQGIQFTRLTSLHGGTDFSLVRDAQIIVITAGKAQAEHQTRTDLLQNNYALFKKIIPRIVQENNKAIFLIVTNPVDIMTSIALHLSNLDACQVFGTGTVLDSARLRYTLGNILQVSPKDIIAHVLGEHGDAEFIAWSSATVAGIPLHLFHTFSDQEKKEIQTEVKQAAYNIIAKKGSTCYAIALVISKVVAAIALNQSRLFTLSTALHEEHQRIPLCMSRPTIVTGSGICKIIPLNLSESEMAAWEDAKKHLTDTLQTLSL
jgi:L-lactate dehydrogenase